MTETLSDKSYPIRNVNGMMPCDVYKEEDVKDFIKKLKEEIDKKITTNLQGIAHSRCEGLWLAKEIIDKLAGKNLI